MGLNLSGYPSEEEIAESERRDRELFERCPVGTVLWTMTGIHHEGKAYWAPEPYAIQRADETGYWTCANPLPQGAAGNSWGNIGLNCFLTREECLADWGDRPLAQDEKPGAPQYAPKPEDYGKKTIWRDGDGTDIVLIHVGHGREEFGLGLLRWRGEGETAEPGGGGECLTLDEIRDQINARRAGALIEVRVESPLKGVIHQTGDYPGNDCWHEEGRTKGYA